jgi:hypothetical protein
MQARSFRKLEGMDLLLHSRHPMNRDKCNDRNFPKFHGQRFMLTFIQCLSVWSLVAVEAVTPDYGHG